MSLSGEESISMVISLPAGISWNEIKRDSTGVYFLPLIVKIRAV